MPRKDRMFDSAKRWHRTALLSAAIFAFSGCQTIENPREPSALSNTDWVLIGYVPQAGAGEFNEVQLYSYTLRLAADGSTELKLACNKGTGNWTGTSASDAKGTIKFLSLAATAASCPNDPVGDRIAADLPRITNWSIDDARLTLGVDNGGAEYVWDSID